MNTAPERSALDYISVACDVNLAPLFKTEDGPLSIEIDPVAIAAIYDELNPTGEPLSRPLLFVAVHDDHFASKKSSNEGIVTLGRYSGPQRKLWRKTKAQDSIEVGVGGGLHAYIDTPEENLKKAFDVLVGDSSDAVYSLLTKSGARENANTAASIYDILSKVRPVFKSEATIQTLAVHELQHAVNENDPVISENTRMFRRREYAKVLLRSLLPVFILPQGINITLQETTTIPQTPIIIIMIGSTVIGSLCAEKFLERKNRWNAYMNNPDEIFARKSEEQAATFMPIVTIVK